MTVLPDTPVGPEFFAPGARPARRASIGALQRQVERLRSCLVPVPAGTSGLPALRAGYRRLGAAPRPSGRRAGPVPDAPVVAAVGAFPPPPARTVQRQAGGPVAGSRPAQDIRRRRL